MHIIQKYTIVKHAGNTWDKHWRYDPKLGMSDDYYNIYTGMEKICGIKENYVDIKEAELACKVINKINPVGDYAVCPILNKRF